MANHSISRWCMVDHHKNVNSWEEHAMWSMQTTRIQPACIGYSCLLVTPPGAVWLFQGISYTLEGNRACLLLNYKKTRMMGLSHSEDREIWVSLVWSQYQRVTDSQTNRWMDRWNYYKKVIIRTYVRANKLNAIRPSNGKTAYIGSLRCLCLWLIHSLFSNYQPSANPHFPT